MKIYSIFEHPNSEQMKLGLMLGSCIVDSDSRQGAIDDAQFYCCVLAEENGQYGESDRPAILVTYDPADDSQVYEPITLEWHAVKDTYDGGRFDYYSSRI